MPISIIPKVGRQMQAESCHTKFAIIALAGGMFAQGNVN